MAELLECGLMNPSRQTVICATGSFHHYDITTTDPIPAFILPPKAAVLRGRFSTHESFGISVQANLFVNGTNLLTDHNLNNLGVVDTDPLCDPSPNSEIVYLQLSDIPASGFARFAFEYIVIGRAEFSQD